MNIGFSTGCLYKSHPPLSPDTFNLFKSIGCNAIELMINDKLDIKNFAFIDSNSLPEFEYISVHAPVYDQNRNDEYLGILDMIAEKHQKLRFDLVVMHPDTVVDFEIFKAFDLPFAIENMDHRKSTCKDVESLKKIFASFDVPMVLDVNHCYSNDPSMQLANDLIKEFGSRIKQVHLSGFETFHEPLFKTRQHIIMDAIPSKDIPIIIESVFDSVNDLGLEFNYIKKYLED